MECLTPELLSWKLKLNRHVGYRLERANYFKQRLIIFLTGRT